MDLLAAIGFSVVLGIAPMMVFSVVLTWFDRYEKEPPLLMLGVFLWGLIAAAGAALIINTLFGFGLIFVTGSQDLAMAGAAVLSAPLVEETVKGLAVLAVFIYFYQEFELGARRRHLRRTCGVRLCGRGKHQLHFLGLHEP